MLRVGLEDTRMGMEILGPYLAHVHIGNGTPVVDEYDESGRMKWKWNFSDLREGLADIPQIIDDLKAVGYGGYISLEEFGPGDDDDKGGSVAVARKGAALCRKHVMSIGSEVVPNGVLGVPVVM